MRQRHHVLCVVVVCLAAMFESSCAALLDQTCSKKPSSWGDEPAPTLGCRARVHSDDALLVGGYEKDGLVHFRIAFDRDVEPLQKEAFKAGMDMWNLHKDRTMFVFEEATTTAVDFRLQRGARGLPNPAQHETTDCSGYGSPGSFIWYSPENMKWVKQTDIKAAARIYAHELGHALNVCHKNCVTSLMREGDPNVACSDRAMFPPFDVPEEDLRDAYICGHGVRIKASALRKTQPPPLALQP